MRINRFFIFLNIFYFNSTGLHFVFEILKEAGLRMPQSVGHALSIVGGLVVGQAAVEAKIVSAPLLIAVALSGISGLMVPKLRTAVFFCRIIITLLAALFGLYGVLIGLSIMLCHIVSLKSFSVDYTGSLDRITNESTKDTVRRVSWRDMLTRPNIQRKNRKRQLSNGSGQLVFLSGCIAERC